jgi:hypothetical protein
MTRTTANASSTGPRRIRQCQPIILAWAERKVSAGCFEPELEHNDGTQRESSGATIIGGVTVGENSVVAAGSAITEDVPPNTLVGGNPARVIRSIGR